jgi:RNA-directed DNA polymerase
LLQAGYTHVVDADLKSYFDTIPHVRLLERVRVRVADGRVLKLIASFLEARVLEEMRQWQPESGTPQGGVISPLLANIYLDPLDHEMVQAGWEMVRYADDFVILCRSEAEAQSALEHVQHWCQAEGLTLHEQKTRVVDALAPGGFDFLGYHFERGRRWPRRQSMWKLRERVRARTRRTSGESLECIITRLNASLRGWFGYFRHSQPNTFEQVDGWVRGRLRSILRQRAGRRGVACGLDHQRYQNAFFAAAGLFSLRTAWAAVRQSHD